MNHLEKKILAALPVIAPAPTGYIVFMAFSEHGWFWPVALLTALALEILGYFSARLIMSVSEHNRTLSATETRFAVSSRRAWFPVLAYAAIALFMTFFVEMFPTLFVWSFLAFPFIGLLSAWVTAEFRVLEEYAEQKQAARAEARESARRAREEKRLAQAAAEVAQPVKQVAQAVARPFTDGEMIAQYLRNPHATDTQLAALFGKSRQAIGNRRRALIENGKLKKDGEEIKVIFDFRVAEEVEK